MKGKKTKGILATIGICVLAAAIPGVLAINSIQAQRYSNLEKEVKQLESTQKEIIEENKILVSEVGVSSSSQRIEDIASNELGMRQAESDEIVRVSVKRTKNGN